MDITRSIAATLAFGLVLFAQTAFGQPPSLEERIKRMQEHLELSDEQADAVLEIMTQAEANCDGEETRRDFHDCMRTQKEVVDEEIEAVLTPGQIEKHQEEQLRKHQERMEERSQNRGERGNRRGRPPM